MPQYDTIDAALLDAARQRPGHVAYQDTRGSITLDELTRRAFLLSKIIAANTKSDAVAVCLPAVKEFPLVAFAVLLAGKTLVPVNFLLRKRELEHVLRDSGADLVLTIEHFSEMLADLPAAAVDINDLGTLGNKMRALPAMLSRTRPAKHPRETAVLLYTSGTTSLPKGVKLTHRNFLAQVESIGGAFDLESFHLLSPLPLFHTFALTVGVMLPALTPARASFMPRFDAMKTLEAMQPLGANTLIAVPSMYRMLMRAARRGKYTAARLGMKLAIAGGEKLPTDVRVEFEQVFGLPLYEGYGLTEHSPVACVNRPGSAKPGTVGKALPGVTWRIVNERGEPQPDGSEGEVHLRSDSVMAGYHNQTTQPIDADGWLATGDLAVVDDEGFLRITGRIKELIISAGKNIHPAEIEEVVLEHPAVAECAAIAVPDKTRGEAPACFIALKEGAKLEPGDLKEWLRDKLSDYKMPRLIRVLPELPHGPTGKVFKRGLAELLAAEEQHVPAE